MTKLEVREKSSRLTRANGCIASTIEANGAKEYGCSVLYCFLNFVDILINVIWKYLIGGVERGSNKCFLVPCPNNERSREVVFPLIREHIAPHTTIVSDAWAAYRQIDQMQNQHYRHDYVIHEYEFVDPRDPLIHTQTVEGTWGHAKDRFRTMHGTSADLFDIHLQEFMWRRAYPEATFANMLF